MPDQSFNYQCPNCGGPLKWDASLQKLHCEYCDSSFTADEVKQFYEDKEKKAAAYEDNGDAWSNEEASHLRTYQCESCGAQIFADENTAVTTCPYCGNPMVIASQFQLKKPKYVLPFSITKKQAEEKLRSFYQHKPFLPKNFADNNHIQEVKSVYVPYWLYTADMNADMIYTGEIVRTHQTNDEIITETSHYRLLRKGSVSFEKVPADASKKMPDDYMDALEPYDYSKLKGFESAYLSGCLADSYDQDAAECQTRADARMKNTVVHEISKTLAPYVNTVPIRQDVRRTSGTAEYAFLPVWLLSTKYAGQNYLFAVNGETGKVVGNLPADNRSFLLQTILTAAILFLVTALILYFVVV